MTRLVFIPLILLAFIGIAIITIPQQFHGTPRADSPIAQTVPAKPVITPNINRQKILANAPDLNPKALQYAVNGYKWANRKGKVSNPDVITIVDFNKPSNKKRMWIINLKNSKVMLKLYTSHGKNSGSKKATKFSGKNNSKKSSLGVYQTLNPYVGKHGWSLRLQGLEKGINASAYMRNIVLHPANYTTAKYIKRHKKAGNSWGCFGIDPAISKKVINLLKDGSIIFAYAKQESHDPIVA